MFDFARGLKKAKRQEICVARASIFCIKDLLVDIPKMFVKIFSQFENSTRERLFQNNETSNN